MFSGLGPWFADRPSKQFLLVCASFLVGIAAHTAIGIDVRFGWMASAILAGCVFWCIASWQRIVLRLVLLAFGAALFGFVRFEGALPGHAGDLAFFNGRTVTVFGTVDAEPEYRSGSLTVTLTAREIDGSPARGRLRLILPPRRALAYGDLLRVRCELEEPVRPLPPERIFSVCRYPNALIQTGVAGSPLIHAALRVKHALSMVWERTLRPDESALAASLFFGTRGLSPDDAAAFRAVGISHITAVSGYNVSLILANLFAFLGWIGLRRRTALGVSLVVLALFIAAAGPLPSLLRASLMALLVVVAIARGRAAASVSLLAGAAVLLLVHNPFLLYDVGFLLSFSAAAGIAWLAPLLVRALPFGRTSGYPAVRTASTMLFQTIAAILTTLPIVLAAFGTISFIAPFANMLILFVLPPAMFAAALLALTGLLLPSALVVPFHFIAAALLGYILRAAHLFARVPFASYTYGRVSWFAVALWYLLIIFGAIELHRFVERRGSTGGTSVSDRFSV